jgi:3-deoxy-D-manno-octulosonic acid (KDO) 8-phosphate synthase
MKDQFVAEYLEAEDAVTTITENAEAFTEKYGLDYWFNKSWDLNHYVVAKGDSE